MIRYNDYREVFEFGRRKHEAPRVLVVLSLIIPLVVLAILLIPGYLMGAVFLIAPFYVWLVVFVGFFAWWGISEWIRVFTGD